MDIPRGRVVGGSSSINGLIFIRGQQQGFDDWEKHGAHGWDYDNVLPYFRSIETYEGSPSQFRGSMGPLQVSNLRNNNLLCDAWLDAARQTGLPDNPDFNTESTLSVGKYQLILRKRWRDSAATSFLYPALKRKHLTLETGANVLKIEFDQDVATRVRYLHEDNEKTTRAKRKVILCAGAIQSPQILQLSGIGSRDLLNQHDVPIIVDAP